MNSQFKYLFQDGPQLPPIYLDHNATTPVAAAVADSISEWLVSWGNPSSIHWAGRAPKALIRDARRSLGKLLNCEPLEIIFTAGGSESNNMALKGFRLNHLVCSEVEHPSIMKAAKFLAKNGVRVSYISVDKDGRIDLEAYKHILKDKVDLVSVMYANNETGHIFPIEEMARLAHEVGALFHCDMVQALGKVKVDLKKLNVDMASFSGHKFYGLKGGGVLYVRKGVQLESLIHGGGQERHRRAGTENVLAIAAMGKMASYGTEVESRSEELGVLRQHLEQRLLKEIPGSEIHGRSQPRLPNTTSMHIPGVDGETLLMNLDMEGYAVSTGAACSSGNPEPSPVLLAMGFTREEAQSSLRLSLGWGTTKEQIDAFVESLKQVVERLRSFQHGERANYGV